MKPTTPADKGQRKRPPRARSLVDAARPTRFADDQPLPSKREAIEAQVTPIYHVDPDELSRERQSWYSRSAKRKSIPRNSVVEIIFSDGSRASSQGRTWGGGETPEPEVSADRPSKAAARKLLRMGEKEIIQAAAELLSRIYPRKLVETALADLAANAADETTASVTGKPQQELTADAPPPAPVKVTREMLATSVPPSLQTDGRQKYEFADELFDDPEVIRSEESIANKVKYKLRVHKPVTPDEKARADVANAFLGQHRRRPQPAKPPHDCVITHTVGDS